MSEKLICLVSLALALGVAGSASAGLVAYWAFDEGSGTTARDSSGNNHHGTLTGGARWVAGQIDGALEFDGVDDYVSTGDSLLNNMAEFALAGWVNAVNPGDSRIGLFGQNDCIEFGFDVGDIAVWTSAVGWTTTAWTYPNLTWHHVVLIGDATSVNIYVDGQLVVTGGGAAGGYGSSGYGFNIGGGVWDATGNWLSGQIDEVRVYDRVLTAAQIEGLFNGIAPAWTKAENPDPADGATGVMSPALMWTAGETARFHNVYLGTSPDLGPADLVTTPNWQYTMYWHLPGFTAGVTYYWRVDEVEADGTTTHTGDVWSFTAAPSTAYDPDPPDGAKYVGLDADLSWTAGATAATHDVYFGTDEAQVTAGTGGTFKANQPDVLYEPGTLAKDTRYYWRIDEVEADDITKHTGDVWSFKTLPDIPITDPDLVGWWKLDEGAGTDVIDWSGHDNHGSLVGDPEWVLGYDGGALLLDGTDDYVQVPSLNINSNTVTIAAWVYREGDPEAYCGIFVSRAGSTTAGLSTGSTLEAGGWSANHHLAYNWNDDQASWRFDSGLFIPDRQWTFVAMVVEPTKATLYMDDGGLRWVVNNIAHDIEEFNAASNIGYDPYSLARRWPGMIDDVRIYNRALTQQEIEAVMRGDPLLAWNANPANGSIPDVDGASRLSWSPGEKAAKHDLYFGTDEEAVEDAGTTSTGIYRGRQDPNAYTPPEGVEFGRTYYWRIDEYNTDATISRGKIWSFTVADYLIVDDFEGYDDYCNRIFYTWPDGWGHNGDAACGVPSYGGNGTGSTVGYLAEPYAEQTIVHEGDQSMPMEYLNDGSTGKAFYSETERAFDPPQDWTRHGVKALTLWFRGLPPSVGSFSYEPGTGVYTMTADGADIWNDSDEFHYVYKSLSGEGEMVAKVLSVDNTDIWAKAGVMIREDLEPNSPYAFMFITPSGIRAFQNRPTRGENAVGTWSAQGTITAPHWVRLVRQGNTFTAYHSTDGANWTMQPEENTGADASPNPQTIFMSADVYVGLALTSHNADPTVACEAAFSDVTITGTVTGQWQSKDIGISSNDAEQLYVVVEDSGGRSKVVNHPDLDAVQSDTWQDWNIDLTQVSDAGVNLQNVRKMYIGVGDRNAPQLGGAGMLYVDDIRLYQPRCFPSLVKPAGDFSGDCVVDYPDLDIMTDNWLISTYDVTPEAADLDVDLVGYYKFEGNLSDSSGNNNHGDPCGTNPGYAVGQVGQALSLDGDYVNVGPVGVSGAAPRTIAGWARATAPASSIAGWTNVFGFVGPSSGTRGNLSFDMQRRGGQDYYCIHVYGWERNIVGLDLEWHHLAATYDGTTIKWYSEGNFVGSEGRVLNTNDNFQMGKRADNDNYFPGLVDEVRVYSRVLSQAEIGSLAGKTAAYTQPLYLLLTPQDAAIDMNSDGTIDLKDYALLVDMWLDELLWP